jgi:hypothetical protein
MEGSGYVLIITEPDPGDPKVYGSYESGYGSGTLRSKLCYFDEYSKHTGRGKL